MSSFDAIVKQKMKVWNDPDLMNPAGRGEKIPFSSPLVNWATYGGIPRNKITEFFGQPSGGKAQPLYSKVLTPSGYRLMGDIKLGDEVFDGLGHVCHVDGVFPQGVRAIYEISLQDGTSYRVADNHLNSVWWYDYGKQKRIDAVLTTTELIEKRRYLATRWDSPSPVRIEMTSVDWDHQPVLVDPYLLGALIGDGSLSSDNFAFTNEEPDVINKVNNILQRDWDCKLVQSSSDKFSWDIQCCHKWYPLTIKLGDNSFNTLGELQSWLVNNEYPKLDYSTIMKLSNNEYTYTAKKYPELHRLEVIQNEPSGRHKLIDALNYYSLLCKSINKHIPKEYLINDRDTRLNLARGLFDTDGYSRYIPKKEISCDWTTASSQLSSDCEFLFRSLGIRDTVKFSNTFYTDSDGNKHEGNGAYTHYLHVPNGMKIFSSAKHESNYHKRLHGPKRNIVHIKFVGYEECKCIHVDSNEHTYITDNFTLTHNTTTAIDVCKNASVQFQKEWEDQCVDLREKQDKESKYKLADLEESGPRKILYLDLEHSFDTDWAETLGVDTDKINIMQPPDVPAEEILQMILDMVESNEVGLIVLDSIPSLVPSSVIDKKIGERTVASLARLMDVFMKKATQLLMRYQTTLLMVNQIRDNMDNPYVVNTPGGQAVKFFCSLRMQFTLGNPIDIVGNELPQRTEDPAGYLIKVRIVKQKSAPNNRKGASYFLLNQSGIKPEMDYAQLAIKSYQLIRKSGGWYTVCDPETGEILEQDGRPLKLQGLPRVYEYLETNTEYYNKLKNFIENDINQSDVVKS